VKDCDNCGTRLERNGVCPNCDEAAYILDWQDPERDAPPSLEFLEEAARGHERARRRKESA
jgi:uncharacterized Zn finger protein (UPF0148 family)